MKHRGLPSGHSIEYRGGKAVDESSANPDGTRSLARNADPGNKESAGGDTHEQAHNGDIRQLSYKRKRLEHDEEETNDADYQQAQRLQTRKRPKNSLVQDHEDPELHWEPDAPFFRDKGKRHPDYGHELHSCETQNRGNGDELKCCHRQDKQTVRKAVRPSIRVEFGIGRNRKNHQYRRNRQIEIQQSG